MPHIAAVNGGINLQATLSASSAGASGAVVPHHPLTCQGQLDFHEDGSFSCPHAAVPHDDERLRFALDHTIAILLMEVAAERFR